MGIKRGNIWPIVVHGWTERRKTARMKGRDNLKEDRWKAKNRNQIEKDGREGEVERGTG